MWAVTPLTRAPLPSLELPPCPISMDPWLAAGVRVTSPRRPSASPARPSRRNSLVKSKWQSGLRFNPLLNVWTALSIRSRWCPPWRRRWPMWRPPSNSSVVGSMTSTAPAFQSWRHTWNKWRRLWHCRLWTLTSIAGNGHSPSRASRGLPTRTTLTPGLHASSWPENISTSQMRPHPTLPHAIAYRARLILVSSCASGTSAWGTSGCLMQGFFGDAWTTSASVQTCRQCWGHSRPNCSRNGILWLPKRRRGPISSTCVSGLMLSWLWARIERYSRMLPKRH